MIRPISIDSEAAQDVPASQQSGAGFTINLSDCNNNTVTGIDKFCRVLLLNCIQLCTQL